MFAGITVNGDLLISEFLNITENMTAVIQYQNVDYSFVNDDNTIFNLPVDDCPDATLPVKDASTEQWCSFAEVPPAFCSISANGTATVTLTKGGDPLTKYVRMIRVRSTVRYDLYSDEEHTDLYASLINRPLANKIYLYMPTMEPKCNQKNSYYPFSSFL